MSAVTILGSPVAATAIIAGGESRRMGQSKALLPYQNTYLINWHVQQAQNLIADNKVECILVCSHTYNYSDYIENDYTRVSDKTDKQGNSIGPLGGISGALAIPHKQVPASIKSDSWLLVVSVDAVISASQLLHFIKQQLDTAKSSVSPDTEIIALQSSKHTYPLLALYRMSLHKSLNAYIEQGERRVMGFIHKHSCTYIDMPDDWEQFANLNTPDDFKIIENKL